MLIILIASPHQPLPTCYLGVFGNVHVTAIFNTDLRKLGVIRCVNKICICCVSGRACAYVRERVSVCLCVRVIEESVCVPVCEGDRE